MANEYKLPYTAEEIKEILEKAKSLSTEQWTFTLENGQTVTKEVYAKNV